jgi:hypothetical protein
MRTAVALYMALMLLLIPFAALLLQYANARIAEDADPEAYDVEVQKLRTTSRQLFRVIDHEHRVICYGDANVGLSCVPMAERED